MYSQKALHAVKTHMNNLALGNIKQRYGLNSRCLMIQMQCTGEDFGMITYANVLVSKYLGRDHSSLKSQTID